MQRDVFVAQLFSLTQQLLPEVLKLFGSVCKQLKLVRQFSLHFLPWDEPGFSVKHVDEYSRVQNGKGKQKIQPHAAQNPPTR